MTLISHEYEFIYLKSRKTAGTTVEMVLEPLCMRKPAPVVEARHAVVNVNGIVGMRKHGPDTENELDKRWFHHMSAQRVRSQTGPRIWDRYRKITCVRNPFTRVVSYYYWLTLEQGRKIPENTADLKSDFKRFVASDDWLNDESIVFDEGVYIPTDIVRFEHLNADCADLLKSLGADHIDVDSSIPHTKSTAAKRKPLSCAEMFDPASRDIVLKRCAWMFERLDYDTQVPE